MSPQVEHLKNIVATAKAGDEAAIRLLRQLCAAIAEKAPPEDLVTIGENMVRLGLEVARREASKN